MSATHETKRVGSDGAEYVPATRADLKPGAVFVLRKLDEYDTTKGRSLGMRFVLSEDDGTDFPLFLKEGSVREGFFCFYLDQLSVAEPGISQEAARQMLAALKKIAFPEVQDRGPTLTECIEIARFAVIFAEGRS